ICPASRKKYVSGIVHAAARSKRSESPASKSSSRYAAGATPRARPFCRRKSVRSGTRSGSKRKPSRSVTSARKRCTWVGASRSVTQSPLHRFLEHRVGHRTSRAEQKDQIFVDSAERFHRFRARRGKERRERRRRQVRRLEDSLRVADREHHRARPFTNTEEARDTS